MAKERLCYGSDGLDATDIPESEEFLHACMYNLPITQEGREAEVDREYAPRACGPFRIAWYAGHTETYDDWHIGPKLVD
ncbi:hypothetical protein CAGA_16700 [Caproiciproducens galactitolivorans]|uniref:Uncharacterized protein n=1 Tax=Caproiciproducens galactitolivorans TaxID=642589 RepID=A0A4Z0XXH8_9FIRM|nr:hypothetical protein CAGA_16700 [Caproiciproducens galactitolivorans]